MGTNNTVSRCQAGSNVSISRPNGHQQYGNSGASMSSGNQQYSNSFTSMPNRHQQCQCTISSSSTLMSNGHQQYSKSGTSMPSGHHWYNSSTSMPNRHQQWWYINAPSAVAAHLYQTGASSTATVIHQRQAGTIGTTAVHQYQIGTSSTAMGVNQGTVSTATAGQTDTTNGGTSMHHQHSNGTKQTPAVQQLWHSNAEQVPVVQWWQYVNAKRQCSNDCTRAK